MSAPSEPEQGSFALVPSSLRFVILASRYNEEVVDGLVAGAESALRSSAYAVSSCRVLRVPGAWELPWAALQLARSRQADAIVALGAVIRGETDHYLHIARSVSEGLLRVMLETGIPIGFGVLTTDDEAQALARAGAQGNKGAEALRAVIELLELRAGLDGHEGRPP